MYIDSSQMFKILTSWHHLFRTISWLYLEIVAQCDHQYYEHDGYNCLLYRRMCCNGKNESRVYYIPVFKCKG